MQVLSHNDGLLANLEVLQLIRERRQARSAHGESRLGVETQHREHIEQKLMRHIETGRCGKKSLESLQRCLATIKRLNLGLSEAELVQIANLLPETDVELYLIIDNVGERLSEEQQEAVKAAVRALA